MTKWRAMPMACMFLLAGLMGCKNFFTPINGSGSGSGTTVVNTGDYAYVVNTVASTVSGFSIGATGTLTALSGFPISLPFVPTSVVVTPSNGFLYVAGVGVLYGYSINTDGTLTQLQANGSVALVNVNVVSMDVSPDGQWLIALDSATTAPTIDLYQISSTGQLTVEPIVQYALVGTPTIVPNTVRVAPTGTYVAASLGTAGDVVFAFDTSTGTLTPEIQVNTQSTSGADQALAFDSTASTLYIARSGTGAGVYPFLIGTANGATTLTPVAGAPFLLGPSTTTFGPASMLIDATGKYLYVGNRTASNVTGFTIGAGGVLTAISGSPFTTGTSVNALAEDNSGKYVLTTNFNGGPDVDLFGFDATIAGKLDIGTTASTGDTAEPAGAVAIAVTHPSTQ